MCCCSDGNLTETATSGTSWRGRVRTLFAWALPVTTLALIPKCPACVAAYVLLFTGIGLSLPTAEMVRWSLVALSLMALAFLVFRTTFRWLSVSDTGKL